MTLKFLEIRDRGTTIPALAIQLCGSDSPVARHAGFGETPLVLLTNLSKVSCEYDPWSWDQRFGRTMHHAHVWLEEHFAELPSVGGVVDVEFILGERDTPKVAEIVS